MRLCFLESHRHTGRVPLVSVVLIFLNEERFIEEAVQSVVDQTLTDWELILVDDGSTDRSTQIAQGLAAGDSRIRYVEHPGHANRGMAASRNFGVAHTSAQYLTFLDADDVWSPTKLAEQVELLERMPDVAMVNGAICRWYSWDPNSTKEDTIVLTGDVADRCLDPPEAALTTRPLASASPAGVDLMVRRQVFDEVGGFEQSFRAMFEDQTFLVRVFLRRRVYVAASAWLYYRQHAESSCARTSRMSYVRRRGQFLQWLEGDVQGLEDNALVLEVVRSAQRRLRWQKLLAPGLQLIDQARDQVPDGFPDRLLDRLLARLPSSGGAAVKRRLLVARDVWRRWWL